MQVSSDDSVLTSSNVVGIINQWMLDLAGLRGRRTSAPPGRCGLIVIDPQCIFTEPSSPACVASWSAVAPNVLMVTERFLACGLPVVLTRHIDNPDMNGTARLFFPRRIVRDDPLSEIAPAFVKYLPLVEVVEKSQFQMPADRLSILAGQCDNVVVTGVQAQLCVLATVLGLGAAGIVPIVLADGIAAPRLSDHLAALRVMASGHACISTAAEAMAATGAGKVLHD